MCINRTLAAKSPELSPFLPVATVFIHSESGLQAPDPKA